MTKPKLICLTPVKNEAWCLDVFLKAASLWADHIIIADQGSTDGSREIAKSYPKVILIDNLDEGLHETNRQRLLFAEARKIPGEKIFIALDADEVFTANFIETNDWQKIINAQRGDVFTFQWANIDKNGEYYNVPETPFQWAIYDDGTNPPKEGYIHVARVPWPENSKPREIHIKDFYVMHLMRLNYARVFSKHRFYQCTTLINEPKTSFVRMHRAYYDIDARVKNYYKIPDYFVSNYNKQNINLFEDLDLTEPFYWQDIEVYKFFSEKGIGYFMGLDIFQKEWLDKINQLKGTTYKDPRDIGYKLFHLYLRGTTPFTGTLVVRIVDKVLRLMGF